MISARVDSVPTTTMASAASPITQVSQTPAGGLNLAGQPQLLARLQLDLRGIRFSVDREKIMNLPESVLLCLFPNGLVLSRQSVAGSSGYEEEDGEDVYIVDVSRLFSFFTCSSWSSLTQTALHMYSNFSEFPKSDFTALRPHPVSLPHNRLFLMAALPPHRPPEWTTIPPTRTPCSANRPLSSSGKNSSTLSFPPMTVASRVLAQTSTELRIRSCWT